MAVSRKKIRSRLRFPAVLLLAMLFCHISAADTVILNNGQKKNGRVVEISRNAVTLQVDEFLQLKLYRAHVKQIITNRSSIYASDPRAVSFLYNPEAEEAGSLPQSTTIDPNQFKVPAPALIYQADFKVKRTDGGLSDGKVLGIDGRPLTDHEIYARDSDYFAKKFRDGMIRTTPPEATERLALLRFLATEVATVQRLQMDLKTGIMMESRDRTRDAMLDSHERFKREAVKYRESYDQPALKAPEYPFAQLIADLESAVRTHQLCLSLIGFEEQLGIRDRVDLAGGKTERARMLRRRMKEAIIAMAAARTRLLDKFSYFYSVGQLPEEPPRKAPQAWFVKSKNTLLFPYQVIEGSAAYEGLLQDFGEKQITRAQPLILVEGQTVEYLGRRKVEYAAAGDNPALTIEVAEVRIRSGEGTAVDYHSGRQVSDADLRGWLLADRVSLR
jgi:hypothetical protein